jgi:hypothetical protein
MTNKINNKEEKKNKTKTYKIKDVFKGKNIRNKNKVIAKVKKTVENNIY